MVNGKEKIFKSGIDIVKTFAVFFVVCVHFFLHSGFYYTPYEGALMYVGAFFRNIFYICVPLFMITTGYLQIGKTFSKKFYFGIFSVLSSYLFIGIVSILFKIFCLKENGSILKWIFTLTNFSADNYAWYVAMFLGLYLLIPFLNNAYNGCKSKNQKLCLILILFFVSCVVGFNFSTTFEEREYYFFNEYWCSLYPFLYYFIGAYIKEYQPKIKKSVLVFGFFITVIFVTTLSFVKFHHGTFPMNMFGEYNSIFTVFSSVLFFLIFYDIDVKNKGIKKFVRSVSSKTLEIYLFSYIFDTIFYTKLSNYISGYKGFLKISVPVVLSVFLLSYFASLLKAFLFGAVKSKQKKNKTEENEIVTANL